ncbi:MAG: hypothetical protein LRY71_09595 [Bacillaceae bacterium]|nr:hypothetical protein [Bacillaceae bacterium]
MTTWFEQLKSYIESVNQAYVDTRSGEDGNPLFIRDEDEGCFKKEEKTVGRTKCRSFKSNCQWRCHKDTEIK